MQNSQKLAAWPMYQGNTRRWGSTKSAVLPNDYSLGFSPLTLQTQPAWTPVIDGNDAIYVCDNSSNGFVSCISSNGTLNWTVSAGVQISSGGPLVSNDGTIYVAGTNLVAFTPQSNSATRKFSYPLGANLVCSGPMALSSDGTTLYIPVKNTSTTTGAVLAITSLSDNQPTQAWAATLDGQVSSGVAIAAADGTVYAGGTNGQLFSVSTSGTATQPAIGASGCPVSTPAIGSDGTVHYLCLDPQQFKTSLYAYQPPAHTHQQHQWNHPAGLISNGPGAAPAIAPDGSVYVSIDKLYKLAWSSSKGYTTTWAAHPSTDHGTNPGPPVIDRDSGVVVFGSDNWLVSHTSQGTRTWHKKFTSANPYLALTSGCAVIFWDGNTVNATKFGGNATLNTLHQSLEQAATPVSGGKHKYPLTEHSITDSKILALVTGALGKANTLSITGDLTYTGSQLTLKGTTSWTPATDSDPVTATLTFSVNDDVVSLDMSATCGANFNLGQAIPDLAGMFWGRLILDDFKIQQSASASKAATGWNASGSAAFSGCLAVAASLFPHAPATVNFSGTIAVDSAGYPTVSLAASKTFTLGGAWSLPPVKLSLLADSDPTEGLIVSSIQISTHVTIANHSASVYASVPADAGTVTLSTEFDHPITASSIADLISWLDSGLAATLKSALPSGLASQSGFGVKFINATITPSNLQVASATVLFSATHNFTIFSVSSPGVSMELSNVEAYATVFEPFGEPTYSVSLSGQIVLDVNSSPVLTIDAEVGGPDWEIWGKAAPGSTVSPTKAIAAMGGSTTLPAGTPNSDFGYVQLHAQPQYGIYSAKFVGTDTWTIFTIGSFTASIGNFSLLIERYIANPSTRAGIVSADIQGVLTLAGVPIGIGGYVDSHGAWQFSASLGSSMTLPSIGQLVGAVSSTAENKLPSAIANLGTNIVIRDLDLKLGGASSANSMMLAIGSGPDWNGWTILTAPFRFGITDAVVKIMLNSGAHPAESATVEGTFAVGTSGAGLRVRVPIPFSSGQFTINLVSHQGSVPVPTVKELINVFSQTLANSLPHPIANLGNNVSVTQFTLTHKTQPQNTSVTFKLGATNQSAEWSPIGIHNLTLSKLGLSGQVSSASSGTTTQISLMGVLTIGQSSIPLKATAENFDHFTLSLNGVPPSLPTVGDFISLVSTSWKRALPTQITSLGSGIHLQELSLTKAPSSSSAIIKVGATSTWTPISGFSELSLNGYTFDFNYSSANWSGSLDLKLTLFGAQGSISAVMPKLKFQGSISMGGSFNMQTVCQGFMGETAPSWLKNIGIDQLDATIDLSSPFKISIGVTLSETIHIGFLGDLKNIELSADFGGGQGAKVCIDATWAPPVGDNIKGHFCYPFKEFKLPTQQKVEIPDDPPSESPEPASIPGNSSHTIATAAGGAGASLATAFIGWTYGSGSSREHQKGARATCAEGAIIHFGPHPTATDLAEIIEALKKCFPTADVNELAKDLRNGARNAPVKPPVTLNASQVAAALATGLGTSTTATLVGKAILLLWPAETAEEMASALKEADYEAGEIGPVLMELYPSSCGTAVQVYTVLEAVQPSFSNSEVMTALYICGFSATASASVFQSVTTPATMAHLLKTAGFTAPNAAFALYNRYPSETATATQMLTVLTEPSSYHSLHSSTAFHCLKSIGYPTLAVLKEMKTKYSAQYTTAQNLAEAAVTAGYDGVQIAAPLLQLYETPTWNSATDLANALIAAIPTLTSSSLMSALRTTPFSAVDAAQAFVALAQIHWQHQNNKDGLAKALADGSYPAYGILNAERKNFVGSVKTANAACKVLHSTQVTDKSQAKSALLAFGFAPNVVNEAITSIY